MTKKDYKRIAAAIYDMKVSHRVDPNACPGTDQDLLQQGFSWAVKAVADALAADNPTFRRAQFYTACGLLLEDQ